MSEANIKDLPLKQTKLAETDAIQFEEAYATKHNDTSVTSRALDSVIFYGESSEVNAVGHHDYNDFLKLTRSKQILTGFDPQYHDFVDYIMKITHQIWEEKGIGIIYDTYHNNVTMHLGSFNLSGIQSVISGTLQTLHAFPDRRLIGQNVIWSRHGENGYLSSHRILSTATNLNDSSFGPATGKRISFRTTVDCAAENNRIYEEWLVRDNLWIVRQLGYDPHEVARRMAKQTVAAGVQVTHFGLDENMRGQIMPEKYVAKDHDIGEWVLQAMSEMYQCRLFNKVTQYYNENSVVHYICDKDLTGHLQIQGMFIHFFASFPNANFIVERVTCNEGIERETYDVAVRWRLSGIHEGYGYFGKPSFKPVEILGITHFSIVERKIVEEWVTFDALDVLKQTYAGDFEREDQQ